jgi:hypothetical protein
VRRLIVVVPLLVFVATLLVPVAVAGNAPVRTTITGKISGLHLTSVTVTGGRKVTCRVGAVSPRALGYVLGSGARITCVNGLLTKIVGTDRHLPSIVDTTPQRAAGPPVCTGTSKTVVDAYGTTITMCSILIGGG